MSFNLAHARQQIAAEAFHTHRLNETRSHLAAGLLCRQGFDPGDGLRDIGREMSRFSLLEMLERANIADGCDPTDDPVQTVRNSTVSVASGGVAILTAVAEASIFERFARERNIYALFSSVTSGQNFKTLERNRVADAANFEPLPRGGTAAAYNPGLVQSTYKIARFARQCNIDEQDLLSDRLDVVGAIPGALGAAAGRLLPDLAASLLLSNPVGSNGNEFFSSGNGNLATGKALSNTNLYSALAAAETRVDTADDGADFNVGIEFDILAVPKTLEGNALALVKAIDAERGRKITVVSCPRLSNGAIHPVTGEAVAGSATSWYLFSSQNPCLEVAYLNNRQKPAVFRTVLTQGEWGINFSVVFDVGVGLMDYRAAYRCDA